MSARVAPPAPPAPLTSFPKGQFTSSLTPSALPRFPRLRSPRSLLQKNPILPLARLPSRTTTDVPPMWVGLYARHPCLSVQNEL